MISWIANLVSGGAVGEALKDFLEDELKLFNSRNRMVRLYDAEDSDLLIDGTLWEFPAALSFGLTNRITTIKMDGVAGDVDYVAGPGSWNISIVSYIGEILGAPLDFSPIVAMEERIARLSALLQRRGSFAVTHDTMSMLGIEQVVWKNVKLTPIEGTKRVFGLSMQWKQFIPMAMNLTEAG